MKSTKKLLSVLVIAIMAIAALTLTGCENKKNSAPSLIGSWDHSGYVYKFNEDKTGSYSAYSTEMKFTYEDKGDKVVISYEGTTSPNEFGYRIEGNKLIIKDSFGEDVVYTKK